ncbi:MAG: hypothetical protein ACQEW9_17665 [Bacteroidota bacterium]
MRQPHALSYFRVIFCLQIYLPWADMDHGGCFEPSEGLETDGLFVKSDSNFGLGITLGGLLYTL